MQTDNAKAASSIPMMYRLVTADGPVGPYSVEELRLLVDESAVDPSCMAISEESIEQLPLALILNAPDTWMPPRVTPSRLGTLFRVDDHGRSFGPYCEETIRLLAAQGYFTFEAMAGPFQTNERWSLYKLLIIGRTFRESRERLIRNRSMRLLGYIVGTLFIFASFPSWAVAFAGHADAAAVASCLAILGIYFAARTPPI